MMKHRAKPIITSRTRGMTLIEVVAGLAILGTLVSFLVVARSRYQHQWTIAGRKADAVAVADELLSRWWAQPMQLPRNGSGQISDKKLRWQTHLIDSNVMGLGVQIVRLEVFEDRSHDELTSINQDDSPAPPLAYVDVVLNPPQALPQGGQPPTNAGGPP